MSDQVFKAAAEALAKAQPDYLGRSAYPPQGWRVEGEEIVILCADGRKVRGPFTQKKIKAVAEKLMQLSTLGTGTPEHINPPAKVPGTSGKVPVTSGKHKAGK